MEEQNEKLERYHNNMKKASRKFRKLRKSISKTSKIVIRILRFIIPFLLSPLTILLLLIIIFFGGLYMLVTSPGDTIQMKKVPSIVLSKDKIEALGFEVYEEGEYKGKIKGCENLNIPDNIYSSFVEGYADEVYKTDARIYDNLCLYHLLYVKKIERYYEFEEENETIDKIDERISKSDDLDNEQVKYLKDEKRKLKSKISLAHEALSLIELPSLGEKKFVDYESDDVGFHKNIDFPFNYFKNRKKDFLDMLYYNHIGSTYGESYPEGISLGGGLFGFGDDKIYYNMLNELGTQYNKDNIATEFLNGNHGLPDFIDDINSRGEYYDFNCPVCTSEDGCSCTGDPEEDYGRNYEEEDLGKTHFKDYLNFINYLHSKKVIYVSENVKSPFRDYVAGGKACNVDIKLTQRDGPSNLSFGFFKGYPKVDGVKTHAGIDLATEDNCNGDEVPVYSITEGIVIFKSYSMSSWGNSIIIKTNINDKDYYVRYSHLKDLPKHGVGDYITTDSLIGTQGDTGPSTAEHLDVTIYNGSLQYEDYLRDTLNWGGLFNFAFTDMMQNGFGDYTIGSYTNSCYNCGN